MLISPAYAQAAGGEGGGLLVQLLPIILIFVVFYFLLIRPQQKRMKQHRDMVANLRRGDKIVTSGGLIGQVTKVVNENEIQVEVAEEVRVRVVRNNVQEVLSKTEPAQGEGGQKQSAANDQGGAKGMLGKLLGGGQSAGQSGGTDSGKSSSGGGQNKS
ncbi:preprotein translocase subunit YajC [Rhodovibrio salinarum]|uniref:Sec translocon accessory complex subunit YajC n=1 Tax=Rhodovibrio salinarum TaxID=1087 RepID=A0A934V0R1_9PROT|nr:preprotein translocase subunit YajC [Rhodovibrio salinarum]MBK1697750.1 preprotein translocase subunit YajC [Rhodovibrio salinarum]